MKTKTITCPVCKNKQTGFLKISQGTVRLIPAEHLLLTDGTTVLQEGTPYIRCCVTSCQHLIQGEELNEVMTPVVKFPSEIKEARNEEVQS